MALGVAIYSAVNTYQLLSTREGTPETVPETLLFSVLPWALIGGTGITIALLSIRLEPLRIEAQAAENFSSAFGVSTELFQGLKVLDVPVDYPLAMATTVSGSKVILISRGAKKRLSELELSAVLWHEWAHVKKGHLTAKSFASRLSAALPWSWFAQCFSHEVNVLAEISADLEASRKSGQDALASAKKILKSIC